MGARSVTTVAPQSLMLLNDAFVQQQARRLVQNLTRDGIPDDTVFIARAFRVVLQREPSPTETQSSLDMLAQFITGSVVPSISTLAPKDRVQAARVRFTAALFNLNEFLHVD